MNIKLIKYNKIRKEEKNILTISSEKQETF